jgi:hypothetical protein
MVIGGHERQSGDASLTGRPHPPRGVDAPDLIARRADIASRAAPNGMPAMIAAPAKESG